MEKKLNNKVFYAGRSMIEMLGVLAIIAVLSVGGISGYSKAMEKWKINKTIEEYSYIIQGLLEHKHEFINVTQVYDLLDVAKNLNLVPSSWTYNRLAGGGEWGNSMNDSYGNVHRIWIGPAGYYGYKSRIVWRITVGGYAIGENDTRYSPGYSKSFCTALIKDLFQPLHDVMWKIEFEGFPILLLGDKYCSNPNSVLRCLKNLTIKDIEDFCSSCSKSSKCEMSINFD